MQAQTGDWLHVHGRHVGNPDKIGQIREVLGVAGAPPYRVRFGDGHETIVFPGPDAVIVPDSAMPSESPASAKR